LDLIFFFCPLQILAVETGDRFEFLPFFLIIKSYKFPCVAFF
jgi:hypothetical protein